jgi:hypothetical protein
MTQYRKKPVVIEAVQWSGDILDAEAILEFAAGDGAPDATVGFQGNKLVIYTLEGVMSGDPGDWLIRGIKGELYPCKPDIFEATYEPVIDAAIAEAGK